MSTYKYPPNKTLELWRTVLNLRMETVCNKPEQTENSWTAEQEQHKLYFAYNASMLHNKQTIELQRVFFPKRLALRQLNDQGPLNHRSYIRDIHIFFKTGTSEKAPSIHSALGYPFSYRDKTLKKYIYMHCCAHQKEGVQALLHTCYCSFSENQKL